MRLRWLIVLSLSVGCGEGGDGPGDAGEAEAEVGPTIADDTSEDSADDSESGAGESGEQTTSAGETTSDTGADPTGDTGAGPSFDAVYETVLVARGCTAGYCHGANAGGLQLTDIDSTYAALIDAPADTGACDLSMLVVEGDASASVLWARVDPEDAAAPGCFLKMPKDAEALTDEEAELVQAWIDGGANR